MTLPALAWVEIELSAMKVDRRSEVCWVSKAAGLALDAHDFAV